MKYIDAEKLIERLEEMKRAEYENCGGVNSKTGALQEVQELISSLQQEQEVGLEKKFTFPKFLFARTLDNKTMDISYAPQSMEAVEYVRSDSIQQEQPRSKFVKVRCVFPFDETWEKDKIYTCEVWHHGDLNRNFLDVYYDYGKDPKYVQFPTIESLNEEFAIIKDESQVIPEQTEVDLEKEIDKESQKLHTAPCYDELKKFAKYFYELGLNARKEEIK